MVGKKPLLTTCSVLAILALGNGARAGEVRITTPQANGVTTVAGESYLSIIGTTVTGNVTNAQGVDLAPGMAVKPVGGLYHVQSLYINNATVTGAVVNAGVVSAVATTLSNPTSAYAYGVRILASTIGAGLTNSGAISSNLTLPASMVLPNATYIFTVSGAVINPAANNLVAGGLANSGIIQGSATVPLSVSLSGAQTFSSTLNSFGVKIAPQSGTGTNPGGSFAGTITNSGTIAAALHPTITLTASGTSSSTVNATATGLYVGAAAGVTAGATVTSNITNSGVISASLIDAATITSSSLQFVQAFAAANGITLIAQGGNGAFVASGIIKTDLVNSGTVMATATANLSLTGPTNPIMGTAASASANVSGINIAANGGLSTGLNVAGGTFSGTLSNAGVIVTRMAAYFTGNGGPIGSKIATATGLSVSAGGGNGTFNIGTPGQSAGGTVTSTILNSGTITTYAAAAGSAAFLFVPKSNENPGSETNLVAIAGIGASAGGGVNGGAGGLLMVGITNTGLVTSTAKSGVQGVFSSGIAVSANGGNASLANAHSEGGTVMGSVINRGTIMSSAIASAAPANAQPLGLFVAGGNATAAGASAAGGTFIGSVTNIGLLAANVTGSNPDHDPAAAQAILISFGAPTTKNNGMAGLGTIMGSVTNSGTVLATASGLNERAEGLSVGQVSGGVNLSNGVFTGAIVNSGTIMGSGTNGALGFGISNATAVAGGITNTGVIIGSDVAIDLSQESIGTTAITEAGGLISGSIVGGGADTISQTGGVILLSPTQKISGLASFTQSGGTLALQVTPAAAPLVSAGTLALHGTIEIVPQTTSGAFAASHTFRDVFTATTPINLTGSSVISTLPFVTASLTPDALTANALDLTLKVNPGPLVQDLTQDLRFGLEEVSVLRDSIEHRLLDGSAYDGGGIASASLSDPGHQIAGGQGILNDPSAKGGLWARGYGVRGVSSPFEDDRVGLLVGGDWHLNDHLVVGLAFDYDHAQARFADAATTKLDAYQGAAYVGWGEGPLYATGLAGGGVNNFSTTRPLGSFGLPSTATSSPTGETYDVYGETGYRFGRPSSVTLTPYLGAGYTHTDLNGFTESGGFGALSVNAGSANSFATTLGLRVSTVIAGNIVPEVRVGWSHEFLDAAQTLSGSLATIPFSVTGVNFGRDSALVGVGVTQAINANARVFVDYDGKITGSFQEHAVSAGVRVSF